MPTESPIELQANALGYDDARAMFEDMYTTQLLSINQISRRLGCGPATVNRWLRQCQIPRRSKGGANRSPVLHYKLHLMDQRYVFNTKNSELAKLLNMNPAYVYKYKMRVKGAQFDALRANMSSISDGKVPEGEEGTPGTGPGDE